jgi:hypothetical protein
MTTIRPSLYFGLGGTGILAIAQTKKMSEDTFGAGNIRLHSLFLVIDFDIFEEMKKNDFKLKCLK